MRDTPAMADGLLMNISAANGRGEEPRQLSSEEMPTTAELGCPGAREPLRAQPGRAERGLGTEVLTPGEGEKKP